MSWIHFMQTIGVGYLCYYVLIISFELVGQRKLTKRNTADMELAFEEEEQPKHMSCEELDIVEDSQGGQIDEKPFTMITGGGLSMSSLVDMAKANVGDYTRNIPY